MPQEFIVAIFAYLTMGFVGFSSAFLHDALSTSMWGSSLSSPVYNNGERWRYFENLEFDNNFYARQRSRVVLEMNNNKKKKNNDNGEINKENFDRKNRTKNDEEGIFVVADSSLLAIDLLAILVSCEILGIIDDVTANGWKTFLDPVTMNSFSTLPLLIRRVSILSITWIVSSLKNKGYSFDTTKDETTVIKTVLRSFVEFSILTSVFVFCSSGISGNNNQPEFYDSTVLETIAQTTFLPLAALLSFRLFYYNSSNWIR